MPPQTTFAVSLTLTSPPLPVTLISAPSWVGRWPFTSSGTEQAEKHVIVERAWSARPGRPSVRRVAPGGSAANAALFGANITYGPLSSMGAMLTAGLSLPETAELNVLMSGMAASAASVWSSCRSLYAGTCCLNASQPGPCGSGNSAVVAGSAYAVIASGTDAAIAAIATAAPNALLVRVFTSCSSTSQVAWHVRGICHATAKREPDAGPYDDRTVRAADHRLCGRTPQVRPEAWVAPKASVMGHVTLAARAARRVAL